MSAGNWFWVIYVILVVFGLFLNWPEDRTSPVAWRPFGWSMVVFVLIGLLGWGIFGPPIR